MIRIGSAFPSGIALLESLWEGAKILVADWINHLPMLVIDGPNVTNDKRDNRASRQASKQHVGTGSLPFV